MSEDVESLELSEDRIARRINTKQYSMLSYYFGLFSLLLFSWIFQLLLWGVINVAIPARYIYMVIFALFPSAGIVLGALSYKEKNGLIGLIINSILVLSFIIGIIVYFVIS